MRRRHKKKVFIEQYKFIVYNYFTDFLSLGGSNIGMPSSIGYFSPHLEHTSPFLPIVYSKSALHRGQARMSNKSFGIGSSTLFCFVFGILLVLKPKALYITYYYFFINLTTVIDI